MSTAGMRETHIYLGEQRHTCFLNWTREGRSVVLLIRIRHPAGEIVSFMIGYSKYRVLLLEQRHISKIETFNL